jgi:hypothetical protein
MTPMRVPRSFDAPKGSTGRLNAHLARLKQIIAQITQP